MLSKPLLTVSGGRNELTSTSKPSRSRTARAYSARLSRWNGRQPGIRIHRGDAVDLRFERVDERRDRRGVRPPRAGRRHHAGAKLADHLLRDFRVLLDLRRVETGQRQLTRLALLAVAGRAVLTDELVLGVDGQARRGPRASAVGATSPVLTGDGLVAAGVWDRLRGSGLISGDNISAGCRDAKNCRGHSRIHELLHAPPG